MNKQITFLEKMKNSFIFFYLSCCIVVALILSSALFIAYEVSERTGYYIQIENGTIFKKEILPEEYRGTWGYIPMRYRIYIEKDVDVYGRVINKKAYYDITEETYSMYSIGDWFDIQNISGLNGLDQDKE